MAEQTGGVGLTVDPLHFDSTTVTARDTVRFVAGLEGEFENGWTYELSANYGRYDSETTANGQIIVDRFFAALDAVTDPTTGQPACRADVDPNGIQRSIRRSAFLSWDDGYFSYTPGSGDCVPLNLWAGKPGASQEALGLGIVHFSVGNHARSTGVLRFRRRRQLGLVRVARRPGRLRGGSRIPGRIVRRQVWSMAARRHPCRFAPSRGDADQRSLEQRLAGVRSVRFSSRNEYGEYDATDAFLELSLPLLANTPGFRELTLDVAGRLSNYSTVGDTESWKLNLVWAPIEDVAFRGSVSQAVRAPNITELFGPEIGATARPADPCDIVNINALVRSRPDKGGKLAGQLCVGLPEFRSRPIRCRRQLRLDRSAFGTIYRRVERQPQSGSGNRRYANLWFRLHAVVSSGLQPDRGHTGTLSIDDGISCGIRTGYCRRLLPGRVPEPRLSVL